MKIDWFTFFAQVINFAVLVWLLNRFLYTPITRAMQKREDAISARLQQAEQQKQSAEQEKADYQALSHNLESERHQLHEVAREEAEAAKQKLIGQARAEIQSRRDDWLESLEREQNSLVNLVRQRAGSQVISTTRKALSQLADVEVEQQMIDMFLKQLEQLSTAEIELIKREANEGNRVNIETAFAATAKQKEQICSALKMYGLHDIAFETLPDLVCGVELHVGGHKIGWSVQEYLLSLSDEIGGLIAQKT